MGNQETHGIAPDVAVDPRKSGRNRRFHRSTSSESLPLPGRRLGAMAEQSGFAMHASQSYPQQLVQLVGHREEVRSRWLRPRQKSAQMGGFEADTPIG